MLQEAAELRPVGRQHAVESDREPCRLKPKSAARAPDRDLLGELTGPDLGDVVSRRSLRDGQS
jgi:hypothetical protein